MAEFRIVVVVDPSRAQQGTRKVNQALVNTGKQADKTRELIKRAFQFVGIAAAVRAVTGFVRTLASFSQAMSTVRAVAQTTDAQFEQLRNTAKNLGATTRFSATQAAEGMTFLARAGFNANQVLGSIEGTLQLAQAGALDLGVAADIASNVLQSFRLEVDQTGRVVDVLAAAANSSNTNVQQLGDGLKLVAPIAAGLGVSIEETTAAVGALSNAGLQASLAGTGLKRVLGELESPSTKTQKIFKQLGIEADEVRISQVGLTKALSVLKAAGVDAGLALELFGQRGGPAFQVLKESIPSIVSLTDKLNNADGTAARVAKTMDDNLNGALLAVKSAFEAVEIALGDLGAESFLTDAFRSLASGLRFVASNIREVVQALGFLASAFVALKLPRLIALVRALSLAFLANPIIAVGAAIVVVTTAMIAMQNQIKLTEDGTVTLGDALRGAATVMEDQIVEAVNLMGGAFTDFDALFQSFVDNFSRGLVLALAITNGAVKAMIAAFDDFPRALKEVAILAWNIFLKTTEVKLNLFVRAVNGALDLLGLESNKIELLDFSSLEAEGSEGGSLLGDAFKQGFNDTLAATLTESLTRRTKEAAEAAAKSVVVAAPAASAKAVAVRPTVVDTDAKEFNELLKLVEREGELLKLSNLERQIQEGLLAAEDQLKRKLTATETARLEKLLRANEALADQAFVLEGIRGPAEDYERSLAAINELLRQNKINQDEANVALRDARIALLDTETSVGAGFERGFLKAQKSMEDFAASSERLITDAFAEAQNAVVNFFKTGEFSMASFFSSMADNLLQLGTQSLFASVFGAGGALGGLAGGGGGGGGGGIGSAIGGLFGFANGGTGTVGANPGGGNLTGVDNRLVMLRARDGEQVSVSKRGEEGGGGTSSRGTVNNFNFPAGTSVSSFRRSENQIASRRAAADRKAEQKNG